MAGIIKQEGRNLFFHNKYSNNKLITRKKNNFHFPYEKLNFTTKMNYKNFPRFDYSPNELEKLSNNYFNIANDKINELITKSSEKITFSTTFEYFNTITSELYNQITPFTFLSLISPSKEIREISVKIQQKYEQNLLKIYSNFQLFSIFKKFIDKMKFSNDFRYLSEEEKRLIEKISSDFLRNGLHLPSFVFYIS